MEVSVGADLVSAECDVADQRRVGLRDTTEDEEGRLRLGAIEKVEERVRRDDDTFRWLGILVAESSRDERVPVLEIDGEGIRPDVVVRRAQISTIVGRWSGCQSASA